ncbi:MAG: undecaprenyldiphospho-muramoylpentapeptide beta-N-acetylglucosaminyltransferase [Myxococcales bacterium]|nr:undecaprenyldiphospho-muramoylpentapeptide beta-N-acetylglucosaminyltransferase [Myxococcales bacterium]
MSQQGTIVLTGGGTGGHIMPALAVAAALRSQAPDVELHYVGTRGGMEESFARDHGIEFHGLKLYPFFGKPVLTKIRALATLPGSLFSAYRLLKRLRAEVAVAFGGYVSAAVGVVAPRMGIPLFVQEQNAIPGRTTRMLSKRSRLVCAGLPAVATHLPNADVHVTGNPVRPDIEAVGAEERPALSPLRLLIMGGSQGAAFLNENGPAIAALLASRGYELQVHHQIGRGNLDEVQAAYKNIAIEAHVEPFIDDMAAAYRNCHIALARSGALSVSELWTSATPAVFVPFPYAVDDHQTHNAASMVETGAAAVIQQRECSVEALCDALESHCTSAAIYAERRQALRDSAPHRAAEECARQILRALPQRGEA